jgi:hypothetical protein
MVIFNPSSSRTQNPFPVPIYITSYNAKSNRFSPLPAAREGLKVFIFLTGRDRCRPPMEPQAGYPAQYCIAGSQPACGIVAFGLTRGHMLIRV